jgi:hypothetical protein
MPDATGTLGGWHSENRWVRGRRNLVPALHFPLLLERPNAGGAGAAIPDASMTIEFKHDEPGRDRDLLDIGWGTRLRPLDRHLYVVPHSPLPSGGGARAPITGASMKIGFASDEPG